MTVTTVETLVLQKAEKGQINKEVEGCYKKFKICYVRKIIIRYERIGYNLNAMRQSACLDFNSFTVNTHALLFNCTPVGRASDCMSPDLKLFTVLDPDMLLPGGALKAEVLNRAAKTASGGGRV